MLYNNLSPLKNIFKNCLENNKSLLAFNVQNIIQLEAIFVASKSINKPVIAQFSSKYIPYFDQKFGMAELVNRYQKGLLFFHLDHCNDDSLIKFCIDIGFASVMYDGSSELIDINIDNANKYYEYANKKTLIEVEIGSIGGQEDGFGSEELNYFKTSDLLRLTNQANFDLLALGIGNIHGEYKSLSVVKLEMLELSNKLIGKFPLVLHGATGMLDEMILKSINYGVVKINFSTILKLKTLMLLKNYSSSVSKYDEIKFNDYIKKNLTIFFTQLINKYF